MARQHQGGRRAGLVIALLSGTAMLSLSPGFVGVAQAQADSRTYSFSIPAKPLASAIADLGAVTGWRIAYAFDLPSSVRSSPINGNMTPEQALAGILGNTGIRYRMAGSRSVVLQNDLAAGGGAVDANGSLVLDTIDVSGASGNPSDIPYETSDSSVYISEEQIERYPGTSPADLLRDAPGVYSGQSRASGGIDANIRGLQGQGRAPVTVDGAQNSTAMYRGYQGITNASFIDPDFIGGISIEKGPSMGATGTGAIGGMVNMRTLNAADIVPEGEAFGARIKVEGGTNTTSPWKGGQSKRMTARSAGDTQTADYILTDKGAEVERPGLFDINSGSASMVAAGRSENLDILAGFSRRVSGNYHAGKNGSNAPSPAECDDSAYRWCDADWYHKGLTNYLPGEEVLNTSQDVYSGILKGTARFGDDHTLQLGYSLYDSTFGEQYASDLAAERDSTYQTLPSHVRVNSYNSRYNWNPASDLIDLKWNVWSTFLDEKTKVLGGGFITKKSQMTGTDLSNTSRFDTAYGDVSLQYGLSYLYEDTRPVDLGGSVRPREGDRWEASAFTNASWQALDWLKLDGGVRYHRYESRNKAPDNTDPDRKDNKFDYSTTVTVMPVDGWHVYGSYKNASRLPSLFESTGGFQTTIDPNLKPETSKTWEIGTNLTREGVLAADDSLQFKASYFDSTVDDYINRTLVGSSSTLIRNIDRARFAGFDLSARYENGGFSAELGGSYYTNVEYCPTIETCVNSSLSSDYATNYVPPEYQLNLTLTQKLLEDRLMLSGRVTHVGPRAADAQAPGQGGASIIAQVPWSPYTLVDLSASYKLTDYALLSLSVENLTDVYYVEPLSITRIPSPGRTVRIGITSDLSASTLTGGKGLDATPTYDWTGFYAGVQASVGEASFQQADFSDGWSTQNRMFDDTTSYSGGFQVGYDYHLSNNVVLGVGGEFSSLNAYKEQTISLRQRGIADANWIAGVHGRVGYAIGDILIYGTAGYAVAEVEGRFETASRVNGQFVWTSGTSGKDRFTGWTAGGGVEYALSEHLSLKGEYSFAKLSHGSINPPELNGTTYSWNPKPQFDQFKLGVNYRF